MTKAYGIIVPIDTPSLGDRSCLVHDGDVGLVVDPQRDIDRILTLLDERLGPPDARLRAHIHNDYVTGGLALAQQTGAACHVGADDEVSFDRFRSVTATPSPWEAECA